MRKNSRLGGKIKLLGVALPVVGGGVVAGGEGVAAGVHALV
jgi:hypothetical protein